MRPAAAPRVLLPFVGGGSCHGDGTMVTPPAQHPRFRLAGRRPRCCGRAAIVCADSSCPLHDE